MAALAGEDKDVDAFLADCTASGDAAYGAAKAVLERLHAPATRPAARRLLGAVRRRFAASRAAGEDCFRTFHFRIHDVVLDPHVQGLAASTTSTAAPSHIPRATATVLLSFFSSPLVGFGLHCAICFPLNQISRQRDFPCTFLRPVTSNLRSNVPIFFTFIAEEKWVSRYLRYLLLLCQPVVGCLVSTKLINTETRI
jgi:hypothetical protein